jgi:hypothetical protein
VATRRGRAAPCLTCVGDLLQQLFEVGPLLGGRRAEKVVVRTLDKVSTDASALVPSGVIVTMRRRRSAASRFRESRPSASSSLRTATSALGSTPSSSISCAS